ncbi:DNA polymerase I [Lysinibacillus sp. LZ02]|uniref:DNA polymerase I n=1 Tax=Lysinibacillus sp. LZ02 TaxID=3420668 RepID=UPI003D3675F0
MNRIIQNVLLSFAMAASVSAWYSQADFSIMNIKLLTVPVFFLIVYGLSLVIAEDVRNAFKKVLWFDKREDKRPIWQVGVGIIFFFAQIGFVETFARSLMQFNLGGMPLYIIFSFMNAFLLTVIYEEVFYVEEKVAKQYKFKKLK